MPDPAAPAAAPAADANRHVLAIRGPDAESFLQGLVTNDVRKLSAGPVYAALLTPQGKYLADFLLLRQGDAILLDLPATLGADVARRLALYRLRAQVTIAEAGLSVWRGTGPAPAGAVADPRHPALGWRVYAAAPPALPPGADPAPDWDAIRVAQCIPEAGVELVPGESYILEAGFERLNGVDFRKGCYVGQEVTARMKHKTDLRKGLVTVELDGHAAPGTPIEAAGKPAGTLYTSAGGRGIAWLRFDRADSAMTAGAARVRLADAAAQNMAQS
jgi:folate-binding protein YgfZ